MSEQLPLNFDCPDEPKEKPETETDYSKKPGAIWNGVIWATDEDVAL